MLETLQRAKVDGCISDLTFDKWRAGEFEPRAVAGFEQHLAHCGACSARHCELNEQAEAFLSRFPSLVIPERAASKLSEAVKSRKKLSRVRSWGVAVATLAVAAGVALVARPPGVDPRSGEQTRSKGAARLGFHVKRGERVVLGADGQEVRPGDQLRFFVSTAKPQHLAILSRDGAGLVSEYYPGTGQSRSVDAVRNLSLDSSVELDGTLGKEELWAVFCDAPFATGPLRRTLATQGILSAPADCSIERVLIVKKTEP